MIAFNEFTLSNGLRVIVHEDPTVQIAVMNIECPKCGSKAGFRDVEVEDKSGGDIFWVFGLMAYLVHRESLRQKVLCESCGLVFSPKKKRNWWADLAVLILLLILVAVVIRSFIYSSPPISK